MAQYECTFIVRQDLSKPDVEKLTDSMAAILEKNGGKIVKRENWGLRPLAYEINKNRKGHYVMLGVDANGAALDAMTNEMRLSEEIIRNLEIKVEKLDNKPSAPMQRGDDYAAA